MSNVWGSSTLFLASLYASSLPKICVCVLTLRMMMLWWEFTYYVYTTSYEEFVRVAILGGETPNVVEE